jgi:hypothetical protein
MFFSFSPECVVTDAVEAKLSIFNTGFFILENNTSLSILIGATTTADRKAGVWRGAGAVAHHGRQSSEPNRRQFFESGREKIILRTENKMRRAISLR